MDAVVVATHLRPGDRMRTLRIHLNQPTYRIASERLYAGQGAQTIYKAVLQLAAQLSVARNLGSEEEP